ncbi:MAG: hypothetical protein WBO57_00265, partial [Gammaproteobacteria bacterium]
CLASESSDRKLPTNKAYVAVSLFAIVLIWTADLLEIISFASRAFALYYLLQCIVALMVSYHHHYENWAYFAHRAHFATVATILAFVVVFAIPAK